MKKINIRKSNLSLCCWCCCCCCCWICGVSLEKCASRLSFIISLAISGADFHWMDETNIQFITYVLLLIFVLFCSLSINLIRLHKHHRIEMHCGVSVISCDVSTGSPFNSVILFYICFYRARMISFGVFLAAKQAKICLRARIAIHELKYNMKTAQKHNELCLIKPNDTLTMYV